MSPSSTCRALAACALVFLLAVHHTNAQQSEWTWKDKDGITHTRAELKSVVQEHKGWVNPVSGKDARFFHRPLSIDLEGADLTEADLSGTDLADVSLKGAVLTRAFLDHSNLKKANLDSALLTEADLSGADLTGAELYGADFRGARLHGANLSNVSLESAKLSHADLTNGNLTGAYLGFADLSDVQLTGADLTNASIHHAELLGAIFEPKSLPNVREMATGKSLELLTYEDNPDALVQLRKEFADGGFRDQERKVTYALMRIQAELSWEECKSRKTGDKTRAILWSSDSNLANCGSFVLNKVFFDWTCQYGMSPGRPLSLGVLLWLLCSILYFVSIRSRGKSGLYRVYAENIQDDPPGQKRVKKISPPVIAGTGRVRRLLQFFWREWVVLRASMFFSLMSAFNIGFRDINFGRWLRLLTRQEFDIKAVGWARVVAGWQSLISVYFIALWVLTYFGRPFG